MLGIVLLIVILMLMVRKIMATIEENSAKVDAITTAVQAIDLKLDDVRALVATLKAGQVNQEQLDALSAKLDGLTVATAAVTSEVESIE